MTKPGRKRGKLEDALNHRCCPKTAACCNKKLEAELAAVREERDRLAEKVYVAGHHKCPKCNFYLVKSIIHPNGICADKALPPQCPNDGTEMMAVTWMDNAQDGRAGQDRLMQVINEKEDKITALEAELAEAKQEIKKSHHSLNVTADDNSRLRAALALIRDEAKEKKTQGGAVARATVGVIQIIAEKALSLTPEAAGKAQEKDCGV